MAEQEIDRLISCLPTASRAAGRLSCARIRRCMILSIVVSLAAHGCIAGAMRHMRLEYDLNVSTRILLSRGQNAPAAIEVSFIGSETDLAPREKPTETPSPQDMVKPTALQPVASDIALGSPEMPPAQARQSPMKIEAVEFQTPSARTRETVVKPADHSDQIKPFEIAKATVRLDPDVRGKPDRTDTARPAAETVAFKTEARQPAPAASAASPAGPGVTDGATLARPISPEYPPACIRRGQQGTVVLDLSVLPSGRAGDIAVFKSSGYARLDASAVAAARRASFNPAQKDGRNIESRVKLPLTFVLK